MLRADPGLQIARERNFIERVAREQRTRAAAAVLARTAHRMR
jgi:hypothetical protein